jgi:transposase
MQATKQCVGIDASKDNLEVQFKEKTSDSVKIKGSSKFDNTSAGFTRLLEWCNKREKVDNVIYVLESTGIYHEDVLYFLFEKGKRVSVELPQRIKYFAKSKGVKTKNDVIDSGVIADYGLERELKAWQPPGKGFKSLRDLSREHSTLMGSRSVAMNRLHAARHSHDKNPRVIERLQRSIEFYTQQLNEIEKDIKTVVNADSELCAKIKKVATIKGVGLMTVVKVIAETSGFFLFQNISQLVSYAGLDVVQNQSGNHKGKTWISKKGNADLRTALYMPALSAIRSNEIMKSFNERIMQTHTYKKQGIVAVMRKLLILIYTLWKKNQEFIPEYKWGQAPLVNFG